MYIFSPPWGWVSKLFIHNVGIGHDFLSNPFSNLMPPPPYFLTTPQLPKWKFSLPFLYSPNHEIPNLTKKYSLNRYPFWVELPI